MSDIPDLSNLFEILSNKNIDMDNILQSISNNTNSNNKSSEFQEKTFENNKTDLNNSNETKTSNNNFQMPDMQTMMKIINLMNSINSNQSSASTNLLYSLKPFLRDSKKEKVDQCINFLKMSSIISEINKSGGDFK